MNRFIKKIKPSLQLKNKYTFNQEDFLFKFKS